MASAATTTANRAASSTAKASFASTVASEWTKLRSVRSTYITAAIGLALAFAMTALVCIVIGATYDDWDAGQRADYDPAMMSISGAIFSGICFAVLGVNFVTNEYSSGMNRLTLTVTPKRGHVILAKVVVITLVMFVLGAISILGMFFLGQAILGAADLPTASITDEGIPRFIIALILTNPLFPVLGIGLGYIIRGTGGSITAVIGLIFGPLIFGGVLPDWWQENIFAYLPGNAADALSFGHLPEYSDNLTYADAPLAALAVVAWLVVFAGAGWFLLEKRDA